ncbi:hypothetical protein ORI98_18070, partial [Shewanella sp. ULN5]|uniref:hypothetical protein n=1 Tax=Shewanella sp. ULN5 TaxID=2994678 RepID=UPI00273E26A0
YNKPSQREFYSLKSAHKIPCLGRYTHFGILMNLIASKISHIPSVKVTINNSAEEVSLLGGITESDIYELLSTLKVNNVEMAFYDPCYPSPSDPGAYFNYSSKTGSWKMTLGNHGWSGGIYQINDVVLKAQLLSLTSKSKLSNLKLSNKCFGSQYAPESNEKNIKINKLLLELHSK